MKIHLPMQGTWVLSLVRELGSHRPWDPQVTIRGPAQPTVVRTLLSLPSDEKSYNQECPVRDHLNVKERDFWLSSGKNLPANARDTGSISGPGRFHEL